jgi:hypothetical protein
MYQMELYGKWLDERGIDTAAVIAWTREPFEGT